MTHELSSDYNRTLFEWNSCNIKQVNTLWGGVSDEMMPRISIIFTGIKKNKMNFKCVKLARCYNQLPQALMAWLCTHPRQHCLSLENWNKSEDNPALFLFYVIMCLINTLLITYSSLLLVLKKKRFCYLFFICRSKNAIFVFKNCF